MPETMKSFSMEKELLESQVRKLQIENTRLQNENNILQNKFKRSQSRITFLEEQILHTDQNGKDLRDLDFSPTDFNRVDEQQLMNFRSQLDRLKTENSALEMQLRTEKLSSNTGQSPRDISNIVEGFMKEISALKEELTNARDFTLQAEKQNQTELNKNKELSSELKKLRELKALLLEEVHGNGSFCVAEKQVRSLGERLKVTEDRLHNERADRAAKLSSMEEKLLKENARLQVSETELMRQLSREKERHRSMETKMKDYRDQVEKLQVTMTVKPNVNNKLLRTGVGSKKQKEDLNNVMEEVKRELNLGSGQESEIIWMLWQIREDQSKELKEYEMQLDVLKVEHGDISKGLKALREEKELYEERLERYRNTVDDLRNEKEDLNNIYKQQVKELTEAKHENHKRAQNMEDMAAALSAENEALKSSLFLGSGSNVKTGHTDEAMLVSLRHQLQLSQSELTRYERSTKLLESQAQSLRAQVAAKDKALPAIMDALQKASSGTANSVTRSHIQNTYKGLGFDQVDQTLLRDEFLKDNSHASHERENEIFHLSVSQKESERKLVNAQDELNMQKSIVQEKDCEVHFA